MIENLLINKAATIERCVNRTREEYRRKPATFAANLSRQDAAILNIQHACEAALDMGQHLIRREHLGISQSTRDVLMIVPTLPRPDAKRPEFGLPHRSVGAIKNASTFTLLVRHRYSSGIDKKTRYAPPPRATYQLMPTYNTQNKTTR